MAASATPAVLAQDGPIGFAPASRAGEARAESHALAVPTPDAARAWLRALTEEPHVAGTPADKKTAEDVRDKLRSWGWQAELAEFEVLLNYPREGSVFAKVARPEPRDLKVTEDPIVADKDSASSDAFPAFHGYGVSGNVQGQVVYANYGRPEDFAALKKLGHRRRGESHPRPLRRDFSRAQGPERPEGEGQRGPDLFRPRRRRDSLGAIPSPTAPTAPVSSIQRGSVQFLSLGPGDPSTPGVASVKGAKRLPMDARHGFALNDQNPIGLEGPPLAIKSLGKGNRPDPGRLFRLDPLPPDQLRLGPFPSLMAWEEPTSRRAGKGDCPCRTTSARGPSGGSLRGSRWTTRSETIWNVIATIKGEVEPERWVMIGKPPRRLGLWSGRSRERNGGDPGNLPGAGLGGQERLEAEANPGLRKLGRRGIRPGRIDRVVRTATAMRSARRL